MTREELVELKTQLKRLNATLKKVNGLQSTFIRGIVYGVGATIGASFIAAIGITVAVKILQVTGIERYLPVNPAIEQQN